MKKEVKMEAQMAERRTDPGLRVLRRVKRRRPHLSRLLLVIRSFRRVSRAPLHRTVAAQIRVRLENRRSLRTAVDSLRVEQWKLRRPDLKRGIPSKKVDGEQWSSQLVAVRRQVCPRGRAPLREYQQWEKPITDQDFPLRVVGVLCGGVFVMIGAMAVIASAV